MDIRLQCSPDADDLFMMRALLEGTLDTGPYRFHIDSAPTDALNRIASGEDAPEVIALSIAHYPAVADRYLLLPHGGSMGEGYGPVVISREPMTLDELNGKRIAIPGLTTTAWCTLSMMTTGLQPVITPIVPYSLIFDALRSQEVDAGLIIHEGRLTYEEQGFHKVADLGEWWSEQTAGLPLPLGGNAIARHLGDHVGPVSDLLRQSIAHALEDREGAIQWLLSRGSALDTPEKVSQYLDMYANSRTLDYGPEGREGIEVFLKRAATEGLLPSVEIEYSP